MDNILTNKQKRCIEWAVQTPSEVGSRVVSETFLLQNQNCNLVCYLGIAHDTNLACPYLIFECKGKIQLPIAVTIHVVSNSKTLTHQIKSITSRIEYIWSCRKEYQIRNRRVTFELTFPADYSNVSDDKSVQTPSYMDNCFLMDGISQDFSKILSESPWHDLEFICGDQSIKAHKSVLSCRSNVFASMLQSDMVEGKTGRVNIKDINATVFRQFLTCLYTGVLPPLTVDTAVEFYEAGDKYDISSLKKQCADFLGDNLLSENAYEILILADRHNDTEFKKNVIDFMVKEQIPYSDERWSDFSEKNPTLALEVLNLFFHHLRPK